MGQIKYRAQILLEPEQHAALAEAAEREKRSISEIVREIVGEWLNQQDDRRLWEQRRDALEYLTQIREGIQRQYGVFPGNLIEEARAERDEENDRVWRGEA